MFTTAAVRGGINHFQLYEIEVSKVHSCYRISHRLRRSFLYSFYFHCMTMTPQFFSPVSMYYTPLYQAAAHTTVFVVVCNTGTARGQKASLAKENVAIVAPGKGSVLVQIKWSYSQFDWRLWSVVSQEEGDCEKFQTTFFRA